MNLEKYSTEKEKLEGVRENGNSIRQEALYWKGVRM